MRSATSLHISQPCHESWDAMTPAAQGRHCAACQKTVVDFTHKTDAEILALLAGAAGGRTCGRFAAGQLGRPLQRAAPAAPTAARWRTWLAAAVAVWGVRESMGTEAKAQAPAEWRARYWGGPVPAAPQAAAKDAALQEHLPMQQQEIMGDTVVVHPATTAVASRVAEAPVLRGVVRDAATNEGLPGAVIRIKGTELGVYTNSEGAFELRLPDDLLHKDFTNVTASFIGYQTQERTLAVAAVSVYQQFQLGVEATLGLPEITVLPPAPWHPRQFYTWAKYWLTRPFRRG